ncbi:hypothetical protein GCM10022226_58730 [Sphaerisporangium flaviroseum]|uniref:Uncharacterized protein n=1 Tax=Sphaerisporangium flaviroseum TaxID=509199 RepID=A0ABP7IYK2_9ACTN
MPPSCPRPTPHAIPPTHTSQPPHLAPSPRDDLRLPQRKALPVTKEPPPKARAPEVCRSDVELTGPASSFLAEAAATIDAI